MWIISAGQYQSSCYVVSILLFTFLARVELPRASVAHHSFSLRSQHMKKQQLNKVDLSIHRSKAHYKWIKNSDYKLNVDSSADKIITASIYQFPCVYITLFDLVDAFIQSDSQGADTSNYHWVSDVGFSYRNRYIV